MWLKNINVRIKQYPKGWAIEIQKTKWYGRRFWIHLISVSGMDEVPWYYDTKEIAIEQAKQYLGWDLLMSLR